MRMKKGISLIVLVITIIVMIILAAAVVISLNNTGIINKASQAVDLTNESAVQDLAALTWADAYLKDLRGDDLIKEVKENLAEQGVTEDKWSIEVSDTGVKIGTLTAGIKFNMPYRLISEINGERYQNEYVFYEDGSASLWATYLTSEYAGYEGIEYLPVGSCTYTATQIICGEDVVNILDDGNKIGVGDSYFECVGVVTGEIQKGGIYESITFGVEATIKFNVDNSITLNVEGNETVIEASTLTYNKSSITSEGDIILIYPDGKKVASISNGIVFKIME